MCNMENPAFNGIVFEFSFMAHLRAVGDKIFPRGNTLTDDFPTPGCPSTAVHLLLPARLSR